MSTKPLHDTTAHDISQRLFGSVIEAMGMFTVYIGDRLGYYRALTADGPASRRSWRIGSGPSSAIPENGSSSRPPRASSASTT